MNKIMVVDDEKKIVAMITAFLELQGIKVVPAYSGREALEKLDDTIELILLDINMDTIDGIEACQKIRENSRIPIIFLSGNGTQYDKVLGLSVGADDYITKPFDPLELAARVKAHIRRAQDYNPSVKSSANIIIRFDDIMIQKNAHKVIKGKDEIFLSSKEFKLLLFFAENAHRALSRKEILKHVWESEHYDDNTVTTYVKRLRTKLSDHQEEPQYIKSLRGVGYLFDADLTFEKG
ncbi:response regulator transcription factor [Geosporobacter ferrireducens]|uniref:Stage 0 sporulation protein A homolog n=1 Tax=Geosporobacter ferrireducens TaxID=1424294 RepID=A0A1D8GJY6_9FIRM|nr:response regulator transcription factor [Geosporobacter ferrireducens]AOT71219.1 hypothetical protein Gferi_17670 [Geosporobacter ferrireducens]MTI58036.1 response regulator transcription factor [Geosporobacter ferrireducens]